VNVNLISRGRHSSAARSTPLRNHQEAGCSFRLADQLLGSQCADTKATAWCVTGSRSRSRKYISIGSLPLAALPNWPCSVSPPRA
jgi:hypothetical protein